MEDLREYQEKPPYRAFLQFSFVGLETLSGAKIVSPAGFAGSGIKNYLSDIIN